MPDPRQRPCIGLVTPAFDRGGLEQVVMNLYCGYRAAGFDCVVLVEGNIAGHLSSMVANEDDVFIFNGDEGLFLRACLERNLKLLHFHYSIFGLKAVATLGLPTIYTLHNVYTWLNDRAFESHAEQVAAAQRIVAVSAFVRNYFCARAGLPLDRVEVIENGVELNELLETAPIRRSDLGLPKRGYLFANVASFHRNKHHGVIIRAAEQLLRRRDNFHVALIGNVGDRNYYEEIKDRLKHSPAAGHVTLCRPLARSQMGAVYRDLADCILLPSIQEGCSNVVQEALAFGRPIVATAVGHAAEIARRYGGVRLVPPPYADLLRLNAEAVEELSRAEAPRNADAVAGAMEEAMSADPLAVSAAELAERRDRLSADRMVRQYLEGLPAHVLAAREFAGLKAVAPIPA